jgi:nucleotide-binding universal stress UspA family protein
VLYDVRLGKPAPVILETARDHGCALIVMSTHGRSGVGRFLFGAVAERVLRETTVPVLLVPTDPGALAFEELARRASPILVPVDFSAATAHQVSMAGRLAGMLHGRVLIGHVIERVEGPEPFPINDTDLQSERYRHACRGLQSIALGVPIPVAPEILIASGTPADEIAAWVREKHVGLLVMALHSGDGLPRMGVRHLSRDRNQPRAGAGVATRVAGASCASGKSRYAALRPTRNNAHRRRPPPEFTLPERQIKMSE